MQCNLKIIKYVLKLSQIKLFRSTFVYTLSTLLNSAMPFFILPILTRHLTTSEYGVISMFNATVGITLPIISLGTSAAVQRKIISNDKNSNQEYVFTALVIIVFSTLITLFLTFIFRKPLSVVLGIPYIVLYYTIIMSISSSFVNITSAILQVQNKIKIYVLYQNLSTFLNLSLSLYSIVVLKIGAMGRIYAIVYSKLIFALIGFYIVHKSVGYKFVLNRLFFKDIILLYGLPLIPVGIKSTILTYTDRIFITNMMSISETGIYSVGNQFALPILLFTSSFNTAYVPWLFKKLEHDKREDRKKIVKFTYVYFILVMILGLVWPILSIPILTFFVDSNYQKASIYIFWLSLAYAFTGMQLMIVNYIYYYKKIRIYSFATIVIIFSNIVLNYILISKFGSVGAAQATMIADFISFLLTLVLVIKNCGISLSYM